MRLVKIFFLISSVCILFIFANCQYSTGTREGDSSYIEDKSLIETYDVIEISNSSFTLEWDSPSGSTPNSYRIYYKEHFSNPWTLLDEIPYQQLEYEINYNDLDGEEFYDFGVSAIYSGEESFLHYSLDEEAEPSTGWYIKWIL